MFSKWAKEIGRQGMSILITCMLLTPVHYVECSFYTQDRERAPLQPKMLLQPKPSSQPKPSLQLEQPLPEMSMNDTMGAASGNDFEHLPGLTPAKYALNLMDAFFTDEEMKGHLFIKSQRSKSTRELLPLDKVKKILCKLYTVKSEILAVIKFGSGPTIGSFKLGGMLRVLPYIHAYEKKICQF